MGNVHTLVLMCTISMYKINTHSHTHAALKHVTLEPYYYIFTCPLPTDEGLLCQPEGGCGNRVLFPVPPSGNPSMYDGTAKPE